MKKNVIVILDVGHGNSTVLIDESGVIIIDAGPKSTLLEFLNEQNIKHINAILISHADNDHICGILSIISAGIFKIDKIRLNTDSIKKTKIWDDLIYEVDRMSKKLGLDFRPSLTVNDGDEYNLSHFGIEILSPSSYLAGKGPGSINRSGEKISTNSISAAILIIDCKGKPILFLPSDIDEVGLKDLEEHNSKIEVPIMVFPHHGGFSGTHGNIKNFTREIVNLINPSIIIFSNGRDKYNNPRMEIINTIKIHSKKIRILCTELSFQCCSVLPQISYTHLTEAHSYGRENGKCCAGSIIIDPSLTDMVLPLLTDHMRFIENIKETALCYR